VTSGPYFTLHKATGEFEQFWYDPTYIRPPKAFKLEAKWQHVIEQKSEIESILPNHTYRDVLLTAFRKYQHAMGLSSDEASIVSLWALLEFLTCSEGKHNDTVRRTAFLYTDELPRLILERIRHSRNRYVHHAEQIEDKQNIHYRVRKSAEHLIRFHLNNPFECKTIQETAKYMSMSTSLEDLDAKIGMFRKVRDFLAIESDYQI
ncbi:MAG: hypothetical protein R3C28_33325, partial [Pirellulaceae bacterium]